MSSSSGQIETVNPQPFLKDLIGKHVIVRIKFGLLEISGILKSVDYYMNIHLSNATECVDSVPTCSIGDVLIRCNSVLHVREGTMTMAAGEGKKEGITTADSEMLVQSN